jgi:hypothetical protein
MNKILMVTAVLALMVASGCGRKQTYETSDGKVTMTEKNGTANYEIKTKEGTAKIAASDTAVTVPDTFPKDVPILKGAVPKLTMTQGKNELLHLHVAGAVVDVAKEYQEKLKAEGWEIETTMNMGDSSMVHAKKDKRTCGVVVLKEDNGSMIQLTVATE